jgi:serine/threonine protein kinase
VSTSSTDVSRPPAGLMPGLDALGAYHLIRPLATGGMARVWLAVDARTGREVALKRMRNELLHDAELQRAFIDEAQLGLQLRHPNLVETIELGENTTPTGVEAYLVLELLQGRALIDVLRAASRQKKQIPLAVIIRIIVDAARGLDYAHKLAGADGLPLGIVHRDATPHNFFICQSGLTKVLDFGIAKAHTQQHRTKAGTVKGKFAYLAPEQIRGIAPDARLDVFALGIVLYELLTGAPLFRGGNDAETLSRVLTFDIPSPESVRDDVSPGLAAITLRALQRDRDRRLPSAAALADAIEAVADAQNISATATAVHAFVTTLFPNDATEHAADSARARRTYEHVSSSSLRAITSNPWMTPAQGGVVAEEPRKKWSTTLAPWVGGVCLTAAAAVLTSLLLSHRHAPPVKMEPPAPAESVAMPEAVPVPVSAQPATPALPLLASHKPGIATPDPHASSHHLEHAAPDPKHHGSGMLRLAAHPWAEVSIDGHAAGTTPMRPLSLTEGPHTVTLTNAQLGVTVKRKVNIQHDHELPLVVDMFAAQKH